MAGNAFTTSADIANRALQRCGAARITALTDNVKNAKEVNACYDKLRRAELQRNVWKFAVRRALLRPVGTALQAWDSTKTYSAGAYVSENGVNYKSLSGANTGNDPSTDGGVHWAVFNGNTTLALTFPAYAGGTTYSAFQVAQATDNRLYMSLQDGNVGHDPTTTTGYWTLYFGVATATQYDSTVTYQVSEIVFYPTTSTCYISSINGNANDPTAANSGWVQLSVTVAPIVIIWPAGTGPLTDTATRNVFVMPTGSLKRAPQDPSAGRNSFLGFPGNLPSTDWVFESNLLLSMDSGPILFRFVADMVDVTQMDDMFCEGLASRIAFEVCEPLTQSSSKLTNIASEYKQFMSDARGANSIENGPVEPPLDDFIATRL